MEKVRRGGLVYSTEGGRMCPGCRRPLSACKCRDGLSAPPAGDGVARVSRESKGRGGKTVTVVRGLPLAADALAALGKRLKAACGAGGTVRDGALEVQGEHCERVVAWLVREGFKVRRAGG